LRSKTILEEKSFSECAQLIKEPWKVNPNDNLPYIGLEHIEQQTLQFLGKGQSSQVTSQKFKFKNGDILFGKLRPYFRKVVRPNFDGICSTDIFVVRAKPGTDQSFLYYWMASQEFIDYSSRGSEGTRMPRAKWDFLSIYSKKIPNLDQQKRIGKTLSILDKKIHLLKNINEILKKTIQSIFKSWFIDFDGQKEFVDSELGKIPKGWSISTLGEICKITMGQSPPGNTYNEDGIGVPFYQGVKDFGVRFPSRRVYCTNPKRFAKINDVLFSVRAPIASLNIANENCCIGRGLAALRLKKNHRSYLYYLLLSTIRDWEMFEAEGTVFGAITKDDLHDFKIIKPPLDLIEKFNSNTQSTYEIISDNTEQIFSLSKIRDSLIPKLTSGEIEV